MPTGQDNPRALGPLLAIASALAGIGLLMAFSVIWFHQGNPALGGAAGMAAIGLVAGAVRHLLRTVMPQREEHDDELPPTAATPASAQVP